MTPKDVLTFAQENNVVQVDYKFIDFPGIWQNFSTPITELDESTFEEGLGFDGSSIRGWCQINSSDMLMIPDPSTAIIDPFRKYPTLSLTCNIIDPITKEPYSRDPRFIAQKSIQYMKSSGLGDTAYFGPEAEFFLFDSVSFDQNAHSGYYFLDSREGIWNSGAEGPNLGYRPRHKEGYFPTAPTDQFEDIRTEMVDVMQKCGIHIEAQHHEVATGGQGEIDMRFAPLVEQGDKVMLFKYIVRNVANKHGLSATFMPKPLFGDNGTGMHVHQSIWKDGKPLFAGNEYAGLSEMGMHYMGGIMKHARALAALTNPTTNSYKRLVPGFEAPVNIAYSARNRSASLRIPMYSQSPAAKRVEVRFPDPSCNPYLAFAAMLMAGIDGIENKIDPGEAMDKDLYELPPEELKNIPQMPGSLDEALDALENDHAFLLKGNVFTEDALSKWIEYKRENEVDALRLRPHPYEFFMYYDI